MSKYQERDETQAKDLEKYRQMVTFLRNADTKDDLKKASLMFVLDMSYDRADICLALHTVEMERGWH